MRVSYILCFSILDCVAWCSTPNATEAIPPVEATSTKLSPDNGNSVSHLPSFTHGVKQYDMKKILRLLGEKRETCRHRPFQALRARRSKDSLPNHIVITERDFNTLHTVLLYPKITDQTFKLKTECSDKCNANRQILVVERKNSYRLWYIDLFFQAFYLNKMEKVLPDFKPEDVSYPETDEYRSLAKQLCKIKSSNVIHSENTTESLYWDTLSAFWNVEWDLGGWRVDRARPFQQPLNIVTEFSWILLGTGIKTGMESLIEDAKEMSKIILVAADASAPSAGAGDSVVVSKNHTYSFEKINLKDLIEKISTFIHLEDFLTRVLALYTNDLKVLTESLQSKPSDFLYPAFEITRVTVLNLCGSTLIYRCIHETSKCETLEDIDPNDYPDEPSDRILSTGIYLNLLTDYGLFDRIFDGVAKDEDEIRKALLSRYPLAFKAAGVEKFDEILSVVPERVENTLGSKVELQRTYKITTTQEQSIALSISLPPDISYHADIPVKEAVVETDQSCEQEKEPRSPQIYPCQEEMRWLFDRINKRMESLSMSNSFYSPQLSRTNSGSQILDALPESDRISTIREEDDDQWTGESTNHSMRDVDDSICSGEYPISRTNSDSEIFGESLESDRISTISEEDDDQGTGKITALAEAIKNCEEGGPSLAPVPHEELKKFGESTNDSMRVIDDSIMSGESPISRTNGGSQILEESLESDRNSTGSEEDDDQGTGKITALGETDVNKSSHRTRRQQPHRMGKKPTAQPSKYIQKHHKREALWITEKPDMALQGASSVLLTATVGGMLTNQLVH